MTTTPLIGRITTGKRGRAQKVVAYGPESVGKSTLGSLFPLPLFLDIEGGTDQLDVMRLGRDVIPDLATFMAILAEVAKTKPCATLVTDTIDWLEPLVVEAVIAAENSDKIKGIEDFGYGKGYVAVKEKFMFVLAAFDRVISAGIHVVLLAHSKVVKFEPPDGAGPYDRYELKLSKHVTPLIKEWCDMMVFCNWRTQVAEKGKGDAVKYKGVGGKERMMYFAHTASFDAKNRHGLADVEKWDIEVIKKAFASVGAPWLPVVAEATLPAHTVKDLKEGTAAAPATTGGNLSASDAAPTPKQPTAPQPATPTEASTLAITALPSTSLPVANGAPGEPATSPCSNHETKPQATSSPAEDHIPGIENPPLVDAELERICGPQSDAVTAYLRERKKITPDQDWRSMPADFATRIKKNPAAFLKAAGAKGGN